MFTSIESLVAGSIVVDTLDDEDDGDFSVGDLSLREAIRLANNNPGPDTITFAPSLNGGTILLDMGEITLTEVLTITGPGAALLTVDAQQNSRIFNITATTGNFVIEGLTLTGGKTTADNTGFPDSTNSGGAIRSLTSGNLTISGSTITDNSTMGANAYGGGIFSYTDVTLMNSTVSGNSTMGNGALGGGIYAFNINLINSTVSGNSTTGDFASGGGLYAYNDVTLINSTISGNSTTGILSVGGGIAAQNNVLVNHSTITENHAMHPTATGGGIHAGNDLTIVSSIVAGNTAIGGNPDLRPGTGALSVDFSLIGDTTGTGINILTGVGNLLNISADLFPLADNGGPTLTHIPMPTSPVIDAGNPASFAGVGGVPEFDQRGTPFVRVRDGNGDMISRIDIGATEVENQLNGPQVIGLSISDNTQTADVFAPKGPTLVGRSLIISVRDLPPRSTAADAPALDFAFASNKALYSVVGDHTGNIGIASVQVVPDPITPGQPATASIRLNFANPLPDDRFTLTMSDSIRDLDGNRLDGESNATQSLTPAFPSGDGVPGGDFVARFTIDSRPELGVYGAGQVFIDANGNFTFDPNNSDPSNRDLAFLLGYSTDSILAGNFVEDAAANADGFDKLAVYSRVGNQWQWLIDFNHDGIPDLVKNEPLNINGIPVAGNFDGNAANGDEVGVFTGTAWYFDTNHDFQLDNASKVTISNMVGYPVVGDFNGDGLDDLSTYNPSAGNNTFSIAVATGANTWSTTLLTSRVGIAGNVSGFAGVRERPLAADMNADGVDDLGLWVPDGSLLTPGQEAEWFFLLSNDDPATAAIENSIVDRFNAGGGFVPFSTAPFGNDIFAVFGNSYMLPIVGNFDPPVAPSATTATSQVLSAVPTTTPPATGQDAKTNPVPTAVIPVITAPEKVVATAALTPAKPRSRFEVRQIRSIPESKPTEPATEIAKTEVELPQEAKTPLPVNTYSRLRTIRFSQSQLESKTITNPLPPSNAVKEATMAIVEKPVDVSKEATLITAKPTSNQSGSRVKRSQLVTAASKAIPITTTIVSPLASTVLTEVRAEAGRTSLSNSLRTIVFSTGDLLLKRPGNLRSANPVSSGATAENLAILDSAFATLPPRTTDISSPLAQQLAEWHQEQERLNRNTASLLEFKLRLAK